MDGGDKEISETRSDKIARKDEEDLLGRLQEQRITSEVA